LPERAEEILRRREVLGWRLGLERMRRLCSLLGMPQNRFSSIHVVGTNGKTSVTLMTAALLEAHGKSAGAYISPHITDWRERIQILGEPISQEAFDAAVGRAEESAQVADRAAGDEGPVTQFELLTAAAFVAFAEARVSYAVIEAGLGGRLDATNVIPSKLTVLTSVGLDHTEYLGDTLEEIAAEKLAVLRDHTPLIAGDVPAQAEAVVDGEAERHHATRLEARAEGERLTYMDRNFALAWATARAVLGGLSRDALELRKTLSIPGRAHRVDGDPPLIFDAAHNPDGARALAETLPDLAGGREVVCCLAVLQGKDAGGIVEALAPACSHFVCAEVPPEAIEGSGRPGGRSVPATELADICREAGAEAEPIPDPNQAWTRARELARERHAVALAAGSHYLLASIWTGRPDRSS
jgi:dihydrofolate synthase / folylpolyglutamate synthase